MTKRKSKKRTFSTLAVLGVYTHRVLGGTFAEIHEVLDHMYPGIGTIGCAMAADAASREVGKQHPEVAQLGVCTSENWKQYGELAVKTLGPTMEVLGPVEEK